MTKAEAAWEGLFQAGIGQAAQPWAGGGGAALAAMAAVAVGAGESPHLRRHAAAGEAAGLRLSLGLRLEQARLAHVVAGAAGSSSSKPLPRELPPWPKECAASP